MDETLTTNIATIAVTSVTETESPAKDTTTNDESATLNKLNNEINSCSGSSSSNHGNEQITVEAAFCENAKDESINDVDSNKNNSNYTQTVSTDTAAVDAAFPTIKNSKEEVGASSDETLSVPLETAKIEKDNASVEKVTNDKSLCALSSPPACSEIAASLTVRKVDLFKPQMRLQNTFDKTDSISCNSMSNNNTTKSTLPTFTQLLSLPIDSLHGIASFLSPLDWANLGSSSRLAHRIHQEVVRRVRMHGYKCATEIATAWKLGQHADAKELAALYISAGVPVYPRSLGHSYHTLLWRMDVEARALLPQRDTNNRTNNNNNNNNDIINNNHNDNNDAIIDNDNEDEESEGTLTPVSTNSLNVDPFYLDRTEFRMRNEYSSDVTYLEEKSLFYMNRRLAVAQEPRPRFTPTRPTNVGRARSPVLSTPPNVEDFLLTIHGSQVPKRNYQATTTSPPKVPIRVHQHLLDQHMQGRLFVNDRDGDMVTPPANLSADFYHPVINNKTEISTKATDNSREEMMDPSLFPTLLRANEVLPAEVDTARELDDDVELDDLDADDILELGHGITSDDSDSLQMRATNPPLSPTRISAILSFTNLEVYTASLSSSDTTLVSPEVKTHLKSRFSTYERRLESFLAHSDSSGFEECILDFWDEFFPRTAMIHYHDRHTPVPRISCLQKFLTRPCPKSIGIVQCEIERIKTSTKGKGVSMKGRFFPTYEYRLFIKNRPHFTSQESATNDQPPFVRHDTVLMTAKNRGRKQMDISGAKSITPTNKKGANNYYLQMPQQVDVDEHFNSVNSQSEPSMLNPNGASHEPVLVSGDDGSPLLGRLQSNFIGTEFQIFTPRLRKQISRKSHTFLSPSDDEVEYDGGMLSDNTTSKRLSRFKRLSLRRNVPNLLDTPVDCNFSDTSSVISLPSHRRTKSCPPAQGRQVRTLRRVANTPESMNFPQVGHVMSEEEDGVITYTANLLGSRPRIMDVCIPKISGDGIAGAQWRHYLETLDDPADEGKMLRCFRTLQQRLDNQEQNGMQNVGGGDDTHRNDDSSDHPSVVDHANENYGLLALQNRPPWWNIELGSFVLNFGGRVSVASVKNFQLCERQDQETILLQFGRIQGRHSFTMDFQHPLSAVQAFAIAISSLQSKISFG